MRPRTLVFLTLWPASQVAAQNVVHLELPVSTRFATFVSPKRPETIPRVLDEHLGTAAEVRLPAGGDLYVWDRETGNVAVRPAAQAGPVWRLSHREFSLIAEVHVLVSYQGRPLSAAQVVLKDKSREQSQLVDPSSLGGATFVLVKPGEVLVTVKYRSHGVEAPPVKQVFSLEMKRDAVRPMLAVSVPQTAETLAAPDRTSGSSPGDPSARLPAKTNSLGNLILYLSGLGIAGAAGWWLYRSARQNPSWVADRMKKLGVDLVDRSSPPEPDTPIPEMDPAPSKPPTKILLEDETHTAHHMTHGMMGPSLVGDSGETFSIPEGETLVGREAGVSLSLPHVDSVSRRHATLARTGHEVTVRDLASTNGTYVNGRRIDAETVLKPGDEVFFGTARFRFQ